MNELMVIQSIRYYIEKQHLSKLLKNHEIEESDYLELLAISAMKNNQVEALLK